MRTKEPLAVLKSFVSKYPTKRAAAQALDISAPYLTDLLYGRRKFSEAMLAKIGLRRMVIEAQSRVRRGFYRKADEAAAEVT